MRGSVFVVMCATVLGAGVAAGRAVSQGPPIGRDLSVPTAIPGRGPGAVVAGSTKVENETNGRSKVGWAARVHDEDNGHRCVEAGRFDGSAFGTIADDGTVRGHSPESHGICAPVGELSMAITAYEDPARPLATVVVGRIPGRTATVIIRVRGEEARRLPVGSAGSFLWVRESAVAFSEVSVAVEMPNGEMLRSDWR